jgi:copper resistance protein B
MSDAITTLAGTLLILFSAAVLAQEPAPPTDHADHTQHAGHEPEHSGHERSNDSESTQSEREHVPPDPPQEELDHAMPYREMADMMQMDDRARFSKVMLDRVEWRDADDASPLEWDIAAWYGGDYDKLWFKTEGERRDGSTEGARAELLWDRIFSRWWSVQAGVRQDFGDGPSRTWAALGVQGLAPYFFDVEATAYVGEGGRTAARLSTEYDLLLTQRLILRPEAEVNVYGKEDPERLIGSGVSDLQIGLRLRYEFRREFAPYLGVVWTRRFGKSADFARAAGEDSNDLQALAGIRMWF